MDNQKKCTTQYQSPIFATLIKFWVKLVTVPAPGECRVPYWWYHFATDSKFFSYVDICC